MARGGGLVLKSVSLVFRILEFLCAAVVLAIFSYYLANLSSNNRAIPTHEKAIEGISGAACLYTILAVLFVCCLGGVAVFSIFAIILDIAFTGAFIYIAWAARNGVRGYGSILCTPLGCGRPRDRVINSSIRYVTAHRMETAVFAVAIIAIFLFFLNTFVEFGLMKHHRKEKAFGPSPNNGYTAGSPKRKFWQRKQKRRDMEMNSAKVNPDALPPHTNANDVRTSYATDTTAVAEQDPNHHKYGHTAPVAGGVHNGYTTQTTTQSHVPYAQQQGYANNTAQMPAANYHASSNPTGTF